MALIIYLPLLLVVFLVVRGFNRKYRHALTDVPGPFLAPFTNLWRLSVFLRGYQSQDFLNMHRKYGPLVRIGPNTVILDDPAHIPEYFGFDKSLYWRAFMGRLGEVDLNHGQYLEVKRHVKEKAKVAGAYTMTNVLKSEDRMDPHISDMMNHFAERCGKIFDISPWMQWAAFDIAMEVSFSNPLGFVKSGTDVRGLIESLHELLMSVGTIALFPSVVRFMQIPWVWAYIAPKKTDTRGPGAMYALAWEQVERRFNEKKKGERERSDILEWLVQHEDREGQRLSRARLEEECLAPVLAGSDTTAGVLRSVCLHVATNNRILQKFRGQIDKADAAGLLSTPPKYEELRQHVPIMGPIMKEALRCFPVAGIPFFRSVPSSGATMCGHFLPAGTEIGIVHYAIGRNKKIWGDDADLFRPERWTEEDAEARRLREIGDVFFSNGPMMCSGRNVATLEVWKIATQIFRQFDIEVVNPRDPWKTFDTVANIVTDFKVVLQPRQREPVSS